MGALRQLTDSEIARVVNRLLDPIPGGKVEAARDFGIDVTLLVEQIKLSPSERARRMHALAQTAEAVRGAAAANKQSPEFRKIKAPFIQQI